MYGSNMIRSTLVAIVWTYSVFAAPAEEENALMEKNMNESCFRDSLSHQLQLHYDMCLGNNLSGDMMLKEKDIFTCALKAAGVVSDEEDIDPSKLKIAAAEEEGSDMKMIEDDSPFMMSVEKCETNENGSMNENFVMCLYETLSMNCSAAMSSEEITESEIAAEES